MSLKLNSTDTASAVAPPNGGGQQGEAVIVGSDMDFAALLNACSAQEQPSALVNSMSDFEGVASDPDNTDQAKPRARKSDDRNVNTSAVNLAPTFFPAPPLPPAEGMHVAADTGHTPAITATVQADALAQAATATFGVRQALQAEALAAAHAAVGSAPLPAGVDVTASEASTTRAEPATVLHPDAKAAKAFTSELSASPLDQPNTQPEPSSSLSATLQTGKAAPTYAEAMVRASFIAPNNVSGETPPVAVNAAGAVLPQQASSVFGMGAKPVLQSLGSAATLGRDMQPVLSSALQGGTYLFASPASLDAFGSVGGSSQSQDGANDGSADDREARDGTTDPARAASDASVTFGMGGWVGSALAGISTGPSAETDVRPAASTGMAQLNVDRIASEGSARRLKSVLQGDMMTGVQTDSFGHVHIKTSVQGDQLQSQISLEHAAAGAMLNTHMSTLEARLNEKYGVNATVHVRADAGSMAGSAGTSDGGGGRSSSQGDAGRQPTPRSYAPALSTTRGPYRTAGNAPEVALPLALASPAGVGRLDITI